VRRGGEAVREVQGMVPPLYRVERGTGTADMVVGAGTPAAAISG
jgi:hypothetical protein